MSPDLSDNKHVLIVDDESTSRLVLDYLFKSMNYTTTLACDGAEALDYFHKESFSVVVMDFNMPRLNGLEAVKSIRQIEGTKDQPQAFIIGLTANKTLEQDHKGLAAGMDVVYTKPITLELLKQTIQEGC